MSTTPASVGPTGQYLLSDVALERRPPLAWLVEGIAPLGALVLLIGEPGVGKSFVALDLAGSVAMGVPWQGRDVVQGPVVLIVGEGQSGLPQRLKVWKRARGIEGPVDLHVRLEAVDVLDAQAVEQLMVALREMPIAPRLVVIDTYARALSSGSDNEARHVGQAITVCDRIRHEIGATVLLLHHPGRTDKHRARGHSSLDGAVDVSLLLERKKGSAVRVLQQLKQKDRAIGEPIHMELVEVAADDGTMSCVVEPADTPPRGAGKEARDGSTTRWRTMTLSVLAELHPAGALYSEWIRAAIGRGVKKRTAEDAQAWLAENGFVERLADDAGWRVSASGLGILDGVDHGTTAHHGGTTDRGDCGECVGAAENGTTAPRRTTEEPRTVGREGEDHGTTGTTVPLKGGQGTVVVDSSLPPADADLSRERPGATGSAVPASTSDPARGLPAETEPPPAPPWEDGLLPSRPVSVVDARPATSRPEGAVKRPTSWRRE